MVNFIIRHLRGIAFASVGIGLFIFVYFTIAAIVQTNSPSFRIDFLAAAQLGDFLSGIFTLLSAALLVFTIIYQIKSFQTNQLENKFFELVKFHRQNVENLLHYRPDKVDPTTEKRESVVGTKAMVIIFYQIEFAEKLVRKQLADFEVGDIYNAESVCLMGKQLIGWQSEGRNINLKELAIIDIAYQIVFFGVSEKIEPALKKSLNIKYKSKLIFDIIANAKLVPVAYSEHFKAYEAGEYENYRGKKYIKYFGGHLHRLGHYFRNFYQAIRYIDESKILNNYNDKYEYIKIIRAQLSTHEQLIIFCNSLCSIGRAWELETQIDLTDKKTTAINHHLITKYNLIKNLPSENVFELNIKSYYPNILFEGEEYDFHKRAARKKLESSYS